MKHYLFYSILLIVVSFCSCKDGYDEKQFEDIAVYPLVLSFTDADNNDLLRNVPAEKGLLSDSRYYVGYMINDNPVNLSSNVWGPVQYEMGLALKHKEEELSYMSIFSDAFTHYFRNYMREEMSVVHLTIKFKCPTLFGEEKIHLLEGDWCNDGETISPVGNSFTLDGVRIEWGDCYKAIVIL